MNNGKAMAIFRQINDDRFTVDEKREAIRIVLDMETHNSITKKDYRNAINWLFNFIMTGENTIK